VIGAGAALAFEGAPDRALERGSATPAALPADRASAVGSVLLGALAASMVAARFETLALAIASAVLGAAAVHAGWPRRAWFTALLWGGGLAIALNLYLSPGTPLPLPRIFGQPATREGAIDGVRLALRLLGAGVALHGLRAAWPGERAADELAGRVAWLERIGVPVRGLRASVALALRFAPLLAAERTRIVRLRRLRAGRAPRTLRERLDEQRAVSVPAVVAAIEMAERVALGLEARHYRLRPVPRRRGGRAWAVAGLALVVVAVAWRR